MKKGGQKDRPGFQLHVVVPVIEDVVSIKNICYKSSNNYANGQNHKLLYL
jgi:hypothetical protein